MPNMPDMGAMGEQMMEMNRKSQQMQQELQDTIIEGQSTQGHVRVYVSATSTPGKVDVSPAFLKSATAEEINAEVLSALINAHEKTLKEVQTKMMKMYDNLGMPSLDKLTKMFGGGVE